jgi:hypothetical protein
METPLDLKEIERKAFRSTFQDGLWDIYMGLIVVSMSIIMYRPINGYSPVNIILFFLISTIAYGLFWAGKKYVTMPRMGQVHFGKVRKQKKRTLAIILSGFVLIQVGLVVLTSLGWAYPGTGARWIETLRIHVPSSFVVAIIGSLMVGISMIVRAYFSDSSRGYYIALMMGLAVFLMIYLNQPVLPIVIGGLIILPGLVLFLRFLKTYPQHREDASNG